MICQFFKLNTLEFEVPGILAELEFGLFEDFDLSLNSHVLFYCSFFCYCHCIFLYLFLMFFAMFSDKVLKIEIAIIIYQTTCSRISRISRIRNPTSSVLNPSRGARHSSGSDSSGSDSSYSDSSYSDSSELEFEEFEESEEFEDGKFSYRRISTGS